MDGQGLIGRKFIFCLFFLVGVGWLFVCGNRKRQTRRRRSTVRRRGEIYSLFLVVFSYFSRHLGGGVGVGNAKKDGKEGKKDSSSSPCQTKPLFGIFPSSSSFFLSVGSCSCVDLIRRRKGGENLPWVHCACVCVHKKSRPLREEEEGEEMPQE